MESNSQSISDIKGLITGEWLSFYALLNGLKLISVANYSKGKLKGYFYNSGNHTYSEEGYYKNDKKHGIWAKNTELERSIIEITTFKKREVYLERSC